jgi:hypothetical protein
VRELRQRGGCRAELSGEEQNGHTFASARGPKRRPEATQPPSHAPSADKGTDWPRQEPLIGHPQLADLGFWRLANPLPGSHSVRARAGWHASQSRSDDTERQARAVHSERPKRSAPHCSIVTHRAASQAF